MTMFKQRIERIVLPSMILFNGNVGVIFFNCYEQKKKKARLLGMMRHQGRIDKSMSE